MTTPDLSSPPSTMGAKFTAKIRTAGCSGPPRRISTLRPVPSVNVSSAARATSGSRVASRKVWPSGNDVSSNISRKLWLANRMIPSGSVITTPSLRLPRMVRKLYFSRSAREERPCSRLETFSKSTIISGKPKAPRATNPADSFPSARSRTNLRTCNSGRYTHPHAHKATPPAATRIKGVHHPSILLRSPIQP